MMGLHYRFTDVLQIQEFTFSPLLIFRRDRRKYVKSAQWDTTSSLKPCPGGLRPRGRGGLAQQSKGKAAALKTGLQLKCSAVTLRYCWSRGGRYLTFSMKDWWFLLLSFNENAFQVIWWHLVSSSDQLLVHIQMAPHRSKVHVYWTDFLTSWHCQFIRWKFNHHPPAIMQVSRV